MNVFRWKVVTLVVIASGIAAGCITGCGPREGSETPKAGPSVPLVQTVPDENGVVCYIVKGTFTISCVKVKP